MRTEDWGDTTINAQTYGNYQQMSFERNINAEVECKHNTIFIDNSFYSSESRDKEES